MLFTIKIHAPPPQGGQARKSTLLGQGSDAADLVIDLHTTTANMGGR